MRNPLSRPATRVAAGTALLAAAAAAAATIGGQPTAKAVSVSASVSAADQPAPHQPLLDGVRRAAPRSRRGRRQLRRRRAAAVGRRLRTLRQSAGISAEQLALRAGIGLDYYLRIETGDPDTLSLLPVDLIYTMASALDTTPAQLLQGLG
jgi:ribosome-binding protein aMBF1 (putative translation factor)